MAPVSDLFLHFAYVYSKLKRKKVKSPNKKSSESQDFKMQSTTFQYAQKQKGVTRCLQNLFSIITL